MITKKQLIALLILLILIGGGVWYFFFINNEMNDVSDPLTAPEFPNIPQNEILPGDNVATSTEEIEDADSLKSLLPYRILFKNPVGGFVISSTPGEFGYTVYITEATTAHIYSTDITSASGLLKLSNTTIPRVHESNITHDFSHALISYFNEDGEDTEFFLGEIMSSDEDASEVDYTPYTISGEFLPQNTQFALLSPNGSQVFYLREFEDDSEGIVLDLETMTSSRIFTSPIREWRAEWSEDSITLFTKPSAFSEGYTYALEDNGDLTKIIGDKRGLTVTKQSGAPIYLISSSGKESRPILEVVDISNNTKQTLIPQTLSEKCIWSTNNSSILYCGVPQSIERGNYPDDWYQGLISFNDLIWRINIQTGERTVVFDPQEHSLPRIDAVNLSLDPDEDVLLFINKKDGSLWSVDI